MGLSGLDSKFFFVVTGAYYEIGVTQHAQVEHTGAPSLNGLVPGEGWGNWVNFCWVCATGLSEPLPHYSLFCGQL